MKIKLLCISLLVVQFCASAQFAGTKVRFKDEDGKMYTGMITYVEGDQFKIKYDNVSKVRYAKREDFTVIGQFLMNSRVDAYKDDSSIIGRGSVIQIVSGDKYKIRFDGCFEKTDLVIKADYLKPAPTIEKTDPVFQPLFGKWQLLAYNYPKGFTGMVNSGLDAPLLIKSDGSYIWYDEYNKPPIISAWVPYAKIAGATEGPNSYDGIILTDKTNLYWKVYIDKDDHIQAARLCGSETREAARIN